MATHNHLKALGKALRARRLTLGLKLREVEERSGVGLEYLSNIERGYVNPKRGPVTPSDDVLTRIASALGIPLRELHAALGRGDGGAEHPAVAYLRGLPDPAKDQALRILEAALPYGAAPALNAGSAPPAAPLEAEALAAALERRARTNSPGLRRARSVTWMLDVAGRFLMSEGRGLAAESLAPGQVVGLRIEDVYRDSPDFLEKVRMVIASDSPLDWTTTVRGQPWHCWTEPLRDAGGRKVGIVGASLEIPPEGPPQERPGNKAQEQPA